VKWQLHPYPTPIFAGPLNRGGGVKISQFSINNLLYLKNGWRLNMRRGVWQALNSLSIHVKFTAIVPGAYTVETKMCRNVLKWRMFRLQAWITGKRLKIDGYIQRGVLQVLNPLSNRVTFTAITPGATPYGGVKCKGIGKSCDFYQYIAIARKRLKIGV